MAIPVVHGSSQARGWIRVAAEAYVTAMATSDPSCICKLQFAAAYSNAKSLTHWMKLVIKPSFSQTLCQVLNLLNHNGNSHFWKILKSLFAFTLYSKVTLLYTQTHTHIYLYIHILFRDCVEFPVLYSRILLFIHSSHTSLHQLIPNLFSFASFDKDFLFFQNSFPLASVSLFPSFLLHSQRAFFSWCYLLKVLWRHQCSGSGIPSSLFFLHSNESHFLIPNYYLCLSDAQTLASNLSIYTKFQMFTAKFN